MKQIVITGGAVLEGSVQVSGAKNAVLPLMAATILAQGKCRIRNIPLLRDVTTMASLLSTMGCEVHIDRRKRTIEIDSSTMNSFEAPYDLVRTMRASCLVMGPLLARMGRAKISLPGGCAIGERPVGLHLKGFEKLGAKISLKKGYIQARASSLTGGNIYFDIPTVTGTENVMMAAIFAKGVTTIENAAKEPEIVNLAEVLNEMGAHIDGAGTDIITVKGVSKLHEMECTVIPDRIEAGTYMIAAAITGGTITIKRCIPEHLEAVMVKLTEAGLSVSSGKSWVRVQGNGTINPIVIKTAPYPGFPTDMQAQMMTLMTIAKGTSVITENIFENRFMHVAELKRMGAKITFESHTAYVNGVSKLEGAPVMATDLRASASLVLAGLVAQGKTVVSRIYHLDRGYERIEKKMQQLGAEISRV